MCEAAAPFELVRFSCIPSGDELLGIRRAISFPLSVSEEFNPMASEQELTPNGKGDRLGKGSSL